MDEGSNEEEMKKEGIERGERVKEKMGIRGR